MKFKRKCYRCGITLLFVRRVIIDGIEATTWECPGCGKRSQTQVQEKGEKDG